MKCSICGNYLNQKAESDLRELLYDASFEYEFNYVCNECSGKINLGENYENIPIRTLQLQI